MKKLFCILIISAFLLTSVGCGEAGEDAKQSTDTGSLIQDNPKETLDSIDIPTENGQETANAPHTSEPQTAQTETSGEESSPPQTTAPITDTVSGKLLSNTGTSINLRADYTREGEALKVYYYLDFYTLSVSAKTLSVTVGGKPYTYRVEAIEEAGDGKHSVLIASDEYTVTESEISITAIYAFRGNYAGVDLYEISLSGVIAD